MASSLVAVDHISVATRDDFGRRVSDPELDTYRLAALHISLDGTLAGGLRSSRNIVVPEFGKWISRRRNVVPTPLNGVGTDSSHANEDSNAGAYQYQSTFSSAHLAYPSWADEDLANYEDGSLKPERQESIKLDRPNNAREKRHIKVRKSHVKHEVKKYEHTRGGPP